MADVSFVALIRRPWIHRHVELAHTNLPGSRNVKRWQDIDEIDEQPDRYRADHGISGTWEARERVVVALTGGPEGDTLVRRAARIAARTKGADLPAVHVSSADGPAIGDPAGLARQRTLVEDMGGTLVPEETPGGGLTMTVKMPISSPAVTA